MMNKKFHTNSSSSSALCNNNLYNMQQPTPYNLKNEASNPKKKKHEASSSKQQPLNSNYENPKKKPKASSSKQQEELVNNDMMESSTSRGDGPLLLFNGTTKQPKQQQNDVSSTAQPSSIIDPTINNNTMISGSGSSSSGTDITTTSTTFPTISILSGYHHGKVIELLLEHGIVQPDELVAVEKEKSTTTCTYPSNALNGTHLRNAIETYKRCLKIKSKIDAFEEVVDKLMNNGKITNKDVAKSVANWLVNTYIINVSVNLEDLLLSKLKPSHEKVLDYDFCDTSFEYIPKFKALDSYMEYVRNTINRSGDPQTSKSVVYIGDCPGVGKSRFALELPKYLIKFRDELNSTTNYHFVNLSIWFNSGFSPTRDEAQNNFILSTAAHMIYSYITHVRRYTWPCEYSDGISIYTEIYNNLKTAYNGIKVPSDLLYQVIQWIATNEYTIEKKPIWIHLTIDEYNQPFHYINDISTIKEWCDAISIISHKLNGQQHHISNFLFTNLLTGTHIHTMIKLQSYGGGVHYLKRIEISKLSTEENYALFKSAELPNDPELFINYLSMGGHARLSVVFIKLYNKHKDVKKAQRELSSIIGSESTSKFQVNANKEEISIFIMLCITGYSVSTQHCTLPPSGKSIMEYQRNNIIFMDQNDDGNISISIPLIIVLYMLKQMPYDSFLQTLDNNFQQLENCNKNYNNFADFNMKLLLLKLQCFKRLKEINIVDRPITIKDLFGIDMEYGDCEIQLEDSSSTILTSQYPTDTQISCSNNVVYKNGEKSPFADLFCYLNVKQKGSSGSENTFQLLCYIQVKHTENGKYLNKSQMEQLANFITEDI